MPWDLFSAGMAAKITTKYKFQISIRFIASIIMVILIILLIRLTHTPYVKGFKKRIFAIIGSFVLFSSLVFGVIFKARWDVGDFHGNSAAYPLFMFCGMAVFNIFSESVNSSAFLITGNPGLVKKVVFPLEILPICNVLTSLVYGLAWFFLLFLGVWILLGQISWFVLLIPVVLLPVVLISSGVSMFVSSLGVYLRDVQQFVGIVTQILFFMTPIFYPATVRQWRPPDDPPPRAARRFQLQDRKPCDKAPCWHCGCRRAF